MNDFHQPGFSEAARLPLSPPPSQTSAASGRYEDSALMRQFCAKSVRITDVVALTIALLLSVFGPSLLMGQNLAHVLALRISVQNLMFSALLLATWSATFWLTGLYEYRQNMRQIEFLLRGPFSIALATLPIALAMLISRHDYSYVGKVSLLFAATGMILLGLNRVVVYSIHSTVRPAMRRKRNVLVVGTGPRARLMTLQLLAHPMFDYQVCGFVDSDPQADCEGMGPVLGPLEELENLLMRRAVDEVLIALPLKSGFAQVEMVVGICGHAGVKTLYSVDIFQSKIAKNHTVDEVTGVRAMEMVHNDQRLVMKEIFDRTAALAGIIFLLPIFAAIALAIKLTSKGPVLFVQERWGMNKRTFGMIKFRSMVVDAEARMAALEKQNEFGGPMFKMKNDPRVTAVGRFLRKTSLDELPQLFNVLKGDMSLVGPRPLPNRDVALFSEPWLMRRFSVKPGITGLWQVSGRSETDFGQTIRLDLKYIDGWSLVMDLKILTKTVAVVLLGKGAY